MSDELRNIEQQSEIHEIEMVWLAALCKTIGTCCPVWLIGLSMHFLVRRQVTLRVRILSSMIVCCSHRCQLLRCGYLYPRLCVTGHPALSNAGVGVKRKASGVVDAPALKSALAVNLALPTDLGIAIRGPRYACKSLCLDEGGIVAFALKSFVLLLMFQRRD